MIIQAITQYLKEQGFAAYIEQESILHDDIIKIDLGSAPSNDCIIISSNKTTTITISRSRWHGNKHCSKHIDLTNPNSIPQIKQTIKHLRDQN